MRFAYYTILEIYALNAIKVDDLNIEKKNLNIKRRRKDVSILNKFS